MNKQSSAKPTIIVFASPKGGVGKSTLCLALAGAIAKKGRRVHIMDLDQNQTLHGWYTQHEPDINRLTVAAVTPDMFAETLEKECEANHDIILIDVAGTADRIMLLAASAADLIITPARLSEPDIRQATRLLAEVETMTRRFQQRIPHQLLVNDVDPLDPHYQRHTLAELERLGLPRFKTLIYKRAAYREAFLSGKPPHYADSTRAPVKKTVQEVDALLNEVLDVLNPMPMKVTANG